MPVRYDPLIARTLAVEARARWGGSRVRSLGFDRGRRIVELRFDDDTRLIALLHPLAGHLIALEADDDTTVLRGTPYRFGRLFLDGVEAPPDERALLFTFRDTAGKPREALALELHVQRWNALRLELTGPEGDPAWRIEAALLTRDAGDRPLRRGALYRPPRSTRDDIERAPTPEDLEASLSDVDADDLRSAVLTRWAWTSALNIDWLLAGRTHERLRQLHDVVRERDIGPSWIEPRRWGAQPYPIALAGEGRASESLLDAFREAVEDEGGLAALIESIPSASDEKRASESEVLAARLGARSGRLGKRVAALERQLAGAEAPETPRADGQLLLARKSEIPRGASVVTLEDFEGTDRTIELDPALDVVANAERLFDEAKRRQRALDTLPGRIADARERRTALELALAELERAGPTDELWELAGGRPASQEERRGKTPAPRLPYTRLVSSGGLEIRVGRGAKDNDELTFRHSGPDDIWLHASQASGAHVILRWGRKDENPPRRDLLEAANAAAVNSGARNSGTVAVVWTRRKHVRKPRKSPPWTVAPDRARTVFVEPDRERVDGMRADES
ncbi:MAG: NFACT RNA binding domain-containing protein [Gemmatimonadetes bacterium]|nr:NFACT RNA binding domain-containing protein [Gemmatimonadota bacterium]